MNVFSDNPLQTEAVIRRRKASNSGVSHSKGEMDDLLRTADKFREDISLQARRNLSMEAQVETVCPSVCICDAYHHFLMRGR